MISVGNKIWKSSDGETWMMTIDHIKPTIDLIPFNTFFAMLLEYHVVKKPDVLLKFLAMNRKGLDASIFAICRLFLKEGNFDAIALH